MDRLRVGHFRSPEMVRGRSGIQNPPASIGSSLSMYIAVTEKPTAAGNTWRRRSIHNVATVHKLPSDVLKRYIHPPLNISIFPISDARFILRPPNSWFLTLRFLRRNKKKKKKVRCRITVWLSVSKFFVSTHGYNYDRQPSPRRMHTFCMPAVSHIQLFAEERAWQGPAIPTSRPMQSLQGCRSHSSIASVKETIP